jgi:uncharacterized membrane protein
MAKQDKYNTNPLDQEYAREADDVWGATKSLEQQQTEALKGATRDVERNANDSVRGYADPTEAPTRRIDMPSLSSDYPSVFIPPTPQQPPPPMTNAYTPPPNSPMGGAYASSLKPSSRLVAGLNLPEKFALVLPYVPFYIGIIAAIIELFIVPRNEIRARFHAAQGLALHLVILLITFAFKFIGMFAGGSFGSVLFSVAAFVFLIVSMIRVWKGEAHHIAPLDDATRWLNERIEPRK